VSVAAANNILRAPPRNVGRAVGSAVPHQSAVRCRQATRKHTAGLAAPKPAMAHGPSATLWTHEEMVVSRRCPVMSARVTHVAALLIVPPQRRAHAQRQRQRQRRGLRAPRPSTGPCRSAQLSLVLFGTQGATGHIEETFKLRNTSTRTCALYGYPDALMLDAQHKRCRRRSSAEPVLPRHAPSSDSRAHGTRHRSALRTQLQRQQRVPWPASLCYRLVA